MQLTNIKASDLLIQALSHEGIEYVFGLPGEETLDVLDSIRKANLRFILTRHEQAAGFMAANYARLTNKIAACLATLGPGATNCITAAAYATLGGMPLVLITGQKPLNINKQGKFQLLDIVALMQPVTKYSQKITNPELIPHMVQQACYLARNQKPGAVHIELPEDIAEAEISTAQLLPTIPSTALIANPADLAKAASIINTARNPIVCLARGANNINLSQFITQFIDAVNIPFFSTPMGKGSVSEMHQLYLGTSALSQNDYVHDSIQKSDLIITIGHDLTEKPPFIQEKIKARVLHINYFQDNYSPLYMPDNNLIGDISLNLQALIPLCQKRKINIFTSDRNQYNNNYNNNLQQKHNTITPTDLINFLQQNIMPNTIIALDNGLYKIWFARHFLAQSPHSLILDNNLATMGAGLPAAIAAALVKPEQQVIAVCGDGGFMMNAQELETAVRLKLNFIIIILRDNAFGMIREKQQAQGFTDFGLDYGNPDFVLLAKSYGIQGVKINNLTELHQITHYLQPQQQSHKGLYLIEIAIDYAKTKLEHT